MRGRLRHRQVDPKGKTHATMQADTVRGTFQTDERGVTSGLAQDGSSSQAKK